MSGNLHGLPRGILPVLQTPFDSRGGLDRDSLVRLIDHALDSGVTGLLAPLVASEVDYLSSQERAELLSIVASTAANVPFVTGVSAPDAKECRRFAGLAEQFEAAAYLVAVPESLYGHEKLILRFFQTASSGISLPLIIQDLQWHGAGLPLETIQRLKEKIPSFAGLKIETVPTGPKYTAVKQALGHEFYVCGGWAVTQLIEALDRGVDAMIPEASMLKVYTAIYQAHASGTRSRAIDLFRGLLPILAFTNQEIALSIAFFKRLLVRKGIFRYPSMRHPGFRWDEYNLRIADELIEHYLALEATLSGTVPDLEPNSQA